MSITELERFSSDLRQQPGLQNAAANMGTDLDSLLQFAYEQGYDFSRQDLDDFVKANVQSDEQALRDEELEQVAGGAVVKKFCEKISEKFISGFIDEIKKLIA